MHPPELDAEHYIDLVTFRRNGRGVHTPVWFAPHDDGYVLFSTGEAGKVKRLRHTSRIVASACTVRGASRGLPWFEGDAQLIVDADEIARAHVSLRKRYGWQLIITDIMSRLSGRIRSRAYIHFTLSGPAEPPAS